jgi:hypothetical protein
MRFRRSGSDSPLWTKNVVDLPGIYKALQTHIAEKLNKIDDISAKC